MTMIAYTRGAYLQREAGYRSKKYGDIKTSSNSKAQLAHIPQSGSRETLCGRPMYEQVDVEVDENIKVCNVCKSRLARLVMRLPGSDLVHSILGGNNLLPAADH